MGKQNLETLSSRILEDARNLCLGDLPIWEKPLLTVVEAAKYFQIGESNIRRITREFAYSDFIYWRDCTRVYIRREVFEKYLDTVNEI